MQNQACLSISEIVKHRSTVSHLPSRFRSACHSRGLALATALWILTLCVAWSQGSDPETLKSENAETPQTEVADEPLMPDQGTETQDLGDEFPFEPLLDDEFFEGVTTEDALSDELETETASPEAASLEPSETEEETAEEETEPIPVVPDIVPAPTPEYIEVFPPAVQRMAINQAFGTGQSILANLGSFEDAFLPPQLPYSVPRDLPIRIGPFQLGSTISAGFSAGRTQGDSGNRVEWIPGRLGATLESVYEGGLFSAVLSYIISVGGTEDFGFNQQLSLGGSFVFPEMRRVLFGYGIAFTGLTGLSRETGSDTDRAFVTLSLAASYLYSQKTSFAWSVSLPVSDYSGGINSSGLTNTFSINNQITPKTRAGIGYSIGFLGVDRGENQTFHRLFLDASSSPTVLFSYSALLGIDYRIVGDSDSISPLFGLSAEWRPRLGTGVTLALESRPFSSATSVNTNFTSFSAVLGLSQSLGRKLSGRLSLGYEYAKYESVGVGGGTQAGRKDHLYYASVGLSRSITDRWSCSLNGRVGENRSDFDPFTFWEVGLYTSYSF